MAGDIAVTGISVSSSAETIYVGSNVINNLNKVQLTATLAPYNPTNKKVHWSSSKTTVATVSDNGLVTAVGTGTCTITATSDDGNFSASCAITVQPWVSVTGITIHDNEGGSSKTIHKNETIQLTAEVLPSSATWKDYIFESENANIATVSSSGLVRGVGVGTTKIVAWAEDGDITAEYAVTVESVQASNTLFFDFYNSAKLTDTNGIDIGGAWISARTTLNGVAVGNDFISNYGSTGTTKGDKSGGVCLGSGKGGATLTFSIPSDYTIADVTIVGTAYDSGASFTVNDVSANAGGSLGSKASAIESVTGSLVFESVGGHTFSIASTARATIYTMEVTLGGGQTNVPVNSVSIANHENIGVSSLTLDIDDTEQLNAIIDPSNATNKAVTWSSDNSSVASVSSTGLLTANAAGSATITVTTQDGNKLDTLNVTVNAVQDSIVIDSEAEVQVGSTTTISATASGSVTWTAIDGTGSVSLSNQSNTGVTITGITAGSATVLAECGTASADCAITVTSSSSGGTSVEVTYRFTSKDWAATLDGATKNWTKGTSGNGFTANQGIQVTQATSGANGTCKESYSNISKVVVHYCTNSSKGAGSIKVAIGSTDSTLNVTKDGGTTVRDLSFDFASNPSGFVQISVTCTTNSIYIFGCTITYTESGSSNPDPITVTGVTVNPTSLELDANGNGNAKTATITATLQTTGSEGTIDQSINWSTGNALVATVSNTGVVTAVGIGNTTITATSAEDGTKFASCLVTVTANVRELVSISITTGPTKTTYTEGDLFDPTGAVVKATYNYAPLSVDITSDVTWTPSGALATSDTKAYANFGGKSASVDITVLSSGPITSGYQLITSMTDLTDGEYVLAGVDGNQRYAFVNTFANSANYSEVTPVSGVISKDDAEGFNITITASDGGYIINGPTKWLKTSGNTSFASSTNESDASLFTINCVGGLFEIYSGSRGIIYRSGYGFKNYDKNNYTSSGYSRLELYKRAGGSTPSTTHVTGITLNKNTLSLEESATETLIATIAPENADDKSVTWSTNNSAVATVSEDGLVTAISEGTATITVTTADGNKTASCAVTVTSSTDSIYTVSFITVLSIFCILLSSRLCSCTILVIISHLLSFFYCVMCFIVLSSL